MSSQSYTHIVIGAGSAGCVVTARLVENEEHNVLLVEAGPDYGGEVPAGMANAKRVPMKGQTDVFDPEVDWNVEVNVLDSSMTVPQARVMGGGSSINGGTALRNSRLDCEEWVALGNTAWSFEDVYTVYQSMENDNIRGLSGTHPIRRAADQDLGKIQKAFIAGAVESGFPYVLDQNEPGAEGVSPSPVCREGSRRISAANTFIDPIRGRPNLTINSGSMVDKILFDGTRATSIVTVDGNITTAKEIIVCAGAIFTPAILQRSGIGPARALADLSIQSIVDLPVGLNLSDHPCIPIVAKPLPESYVNNDYSLQCNARWSSASRPGATDLQLVCFSYLYTPEPDPRVHQGRGLGGMASGHVAGIGCNLNKPTSLGHVMICSRDAAIQPIVTPSYLATLHDQQTARELVRKGFQVMQASSMRAVLSPPLASIDISSDEELDSYIASLVTSTYHFCGSCRMASREQGGVVDQSGKVYGLQGLTIADASILPTIPAANTMWTTMMFAERIGRGMRDGSPIA